MQPTLLILAAGMASRYGSMKQTQGFGPSGETIMDYSIYDAIRGVHDNDFHFNDLTNKALLSGLRTKRTSESSMPQDVHLSDKEITILNLSALETKLNTAS